MQPPLHPPTTCAKIRQVDEFNSLVRLQTFSTSSNASAQHLWRCVAKWHRRFRRFVRVVVFFQVKMGIISTQLKKQLLENAVNPQVKKLKD